MFKRQTRFTSVENYSPSPQLYEPYISFTKMPKTIKTGTLKGPSESNKTLGSFGGVRRFIEDKRQNPGPGSYITVKENEEKEMMKIRKRNKSQIHLPSNKLNNTPKYQQQFYVGNPNQQPVNQHKYFENQEQIKPGYSFPKSRYKQRQSFEQVIEQQFEVYQPGVDQSSYRQLIKIKQQNRKRKFDLLEMMLKKQLPKPNALLIQQKRKHEQKPIPGPGAYNISKKIEQFTQSSSFKSKIQKIGFHSKNHVSELIGPGTYRVKQLAKSPSYCFNRQFRKTSLVQNKQLPCQFYNKQIQLKKSFNKANVNYQAPFGSGTNRFILPSTEPIIQQRLLKIKSRSRSSTRYSDQSQENNIKPLQTIQVLTDFYRNK